jgi:hypothetical protein
MHRLRLYGVSRNASLAGVIVSHIIVLFDFIEELRNAGEPFEQALTDAGMSVDPCSIEAGEVLLGRIRLVRQANLVMRTGLSLHSPTRAITRLVWYSS